MPGKVIGASLLNGFPGWSAETDDELVKTYPNTGDTTMAFGDPVFAFNDSDGKQGVATAGTTTLTPTAANFKGVAKAHVQSATDYASQNSGAYAAKQAVPVKIRGSIMVVCNNSAVNAPAKDGKVYVRIASAGTGKPIGGFEAAADSSNTLELTNCCWGSTADANGVTELVIKTRINS
jgi:hypothetical protein